MTAENLLVLGILAVLIMLAAGVISAFMNNSGDVAGQEVFQVHLHVIPRYDDEPLGQRDTLLAQATSEQAGQVSAGQQRVGVDRLIVRRIRSVRG